MGPAKSDTPDVETEAGRQKAAECGPTSPLPDQRGNWARTPQFSTLGCNVPRRAQAPGATIGGGTPATVRPAGGPVGPAPLPKRPKGRLLVGAFLLAVCAIPACLVWDSFLRYRTYGAVTGRVIRVSASSEGIVQSLCVREGESVSQGQVLVTLGNLKRDQRLDQIGDNLQVAQATLEAEMSRLRWESETRGDRNQKALAEYYQLWGDLLQEEAKLTELEAKLNRLNRLDKRGVGSVAELEEVRFQENGQRARVAKLTVAVEEMKRRVEPTQKDVATDQLKPQLARIEALQAEMSRLREQAKQGQIRAPVNGRVIEMHRFTGEFVDPGKPILEILEDGSLEAVLYVSQGEGESFAVGQHVEVHVEPSVQPVRCRVVRVGDQLEAAPANIERHYRHHERLLPVYLRPQPGLTAEPVLRLGSEVRLPSRWSDYGSLLRGMLGIAERSGTEAPPET